MTGALLDPFGLVSKHGSDGLEGIVWMGDERIVKHAGPGAHPSGSPQSVHAGEKGWLNYLNDPASKDAADTLLGIFEQRLDEDPQFGQTKDAAAWHLSETVLSQLSENEKHLIIGGALERPEGEAANAWYDRIEGRFEQQKATGKGQLLDYIDSQGLYEEGTWELRYLGDLRDDQVLRLIMYDRADQHLRTWMTGALGRSPEAFRNQEIAKEKRGTSHAAYETYVAEEFHGGHGGYDYSPLQKKVASLLYDAEYARTQEILADLPGDKIRITRGMLFDNQGDMHTGWHPISLNPLSSWTVDGSTAESFARGYAQKADDGFVLNAAVPKEWVVATPLSGRGALHEYEVIVNVPDGHQVFWEPL